MLHQYSLIFGQPLPSPLLVNVVYGCPQTLITIESTFRQEKSGHTVGHDHHHIIKNRWIKVLILDHTQAGSTTSKLPLYMYIYWIIHLCVSHHTISILIVYHDKIMTTFQHVLCIIENICKSRKVWSVMSRDRF